MHVSDGLLVALDMLQHIETDNRCEALVFEKVGAVLYITPPDGRIFGNPFLRCGNRMSVYIKRPYAAVPGKRRGEVADAATHFQDIARKILGEFAKRPAVVPHGLVHALERGETCMIHS